MEQKRFDKKNLIVILALAALIALVAVAAMLVKPRINPTLGELEADPTATPVTTEVPADAAADPAATEVPADAAADPAATEVPADAEEFAAQPAQAYLVVTVAGQMYEPIPLYEEGRYTITRGDYVNTIAVTPTSVWMHESTCDNQDCVEQGVVSLENYQSRVLQNMIICLPNDVMLELYTPEALTAMLLEMVGYTGEEANE